MAPRKRHFLDLLRAQEERNRDAPERRAASSENVPSRSEAPSPRPRAARNLPRPSPRALAVAGGVLALVLLVWLIVPLLGGGPADGDPAHGASAAVAPYGVVAVTYGETRLEEARSTGRVLRDEIFPNDAVNLYRVPSGEGEVRYQLFVGAAEDPEALQDLRARVREASLPGRPEARPFADAYIQKRPAEPGS